MIVDLHSHSTSSDGELTPAELLAKARAAGMEAMAVTDHDTVAGLAEAEEAARAAGIELVPGIELSAFLDGREVHILGHFIDRGSEKLVVMGARLRAERRLRIERMLDRLRPHGIVLSITDVAAVAGSDNLGRPHLARAMVARSYARTVREAFRFWLGAGRPGFVERYRIDVADAIALVRAAGGAATVAHPYGSKLGRDDIARLKELGIAGVEVFHPDHDGGARRDLMKVAGELDLVPTAGSDYHGPRTTPTRALGKTEMQREDLERLRARSARTP